MPSFSARQGYVQPKAIKFRGELPTKLRIPLFEILRSSVRSKFLWDRIKHLFNPYGTDEWPKMTEPLPVLRGEDDDSVAAKRFLLSCPWFQVYDVVEDIFGCLYFLARESSDPADEGRASQFQAEINEYFAHTGIGWQLLNGKVIARGDEGFEKTVGTSITKLRTSGKPTAASHLEFAINALSARPNANTSGAVAHATNAVECVLGEITGQSMTLGKYLDRYPHLFHPALKKALDGIYGYASDEGARHGKEGTQPGREESEFVLAACAAVCSLLARKHLE